MNNISIYTRCGICWESECKHWKKSIVTNTEVLKGILFDDVKKKEILTLSCEKCNFNHEIKNIINNLVYIKCKCDNISFIYSKKIEDDDMIKILNKYPTKFCKECNGSRKKISKQLKKCVKCDGIGGLTCIKCNSLGFSIYNISNETSTEYNIETVKIKKCSCDNGYEYRCTYCNGKKGIAILNEMIECSSCY